MISSDNVLTCRQLINHPQPLLSKEGGEAVLPNLQFGSIELGICNAHSRGFDYLGLQILILDAFELQIQTNGVKRTGSNEQGQTNGGLLHPPCEAGNKQ